MAATMMMAYGAPPKPTASCGDAPNDEKGIP